MLNWLNVHGITLLAFGALILGGAATVLFPGLTTIYTPYSIAVVSLSLGQHSYNGFTNYMGSGVDPNQPSPNI